MFQAWPLIHIIIAAKKKKPNTKGQNKRSFGYIFVVSFLRKTPFQVSNLTRCDAGKIVLSGEKIKDSDL